MPTQTFLNLPKEKQNKILESAKLEFSNHLYEDASINRIIKNIDMCRGTFYLYFTNKEDLYFYMIGLLKEKMKKTLKKISKENNKDVKKIFISIFDYEIKNKNLINNIFINFNTNHVEKIMPPEIINKEILNLFDFSKYNVNDDYIFVVIHILNTMLVQSIGIALKNNDINKIRNMYIKEIDLILKGIERGNV